MITPELARAWLAGLGGRRFLLSVGAGLAATLLVAAEKISDGVFATIVVATVAAYITGNTSQKRSEGNE